VVISAGEILDPLNDLIEQFSWLTLLAATSRRADHARRNVRDDAVNTVLSVVVLLGIAALWWPRERSGLTVSPATAHRDTAVHALRHRRCDAQPAFVNEHFPTQREEAAVDFLSQTRTKIESTTEERMMRARRPIRCWNA
jgi:hypothetical protein